MNYFLTFLVAFLWGVNSFLNRLSVERMPPILMQVIIGLTYMLFIPIGLRLSGINNPLTYKWSYYSIGLTGLAAILSICAEILLYNTLKGSKNFGASVMIVSMYPAVTLILSFIFLDEQLNKYKIFGIIMMLLGSCLITIK